MATWADLKSHIHSHYTVGEDQGEAVRLLFNLDGGRSQVVIIHHEQIRDGSDWAVVESVIGPLDRINVVAVLESVSGVVCGGLGRIGDLLTLRDAFPLSNLDINEFEAPMALITTTADELERAHVGGDAF